MNKKFAILFLKIAGGMWLFISSVVVSVYTTIWLFETQHVVIYTIALSFWVCFYVGAIMAWIVSHDI